MLWRHYTKQMRQYAWRSLSFYLSGTRSSCILGFTASTAGRWHRRITSSQALNNTQIKCEPEIRTDPNGSKSGSGTLLKERHCHNAILKKTLKHTAQYRTVAPDQTLSDPDPNIKIWFIYESLRIRFQVKNIKTDPYKSKLEIFFH